MSTPLTIRLTAIVAAFFLPVGLVSAETVLGPLEIDLERSAFFTAVDGQLAEVPVGLYEVSRVDDSTLALNGETGAYQIRATEYEHGEPVASELAVSFSDGDNAHNIVLLNPEGHSLAAIGSYNGVVTRGRQVLNLQSYRTQVGTAVSRPRISSSTIDRNRVRPSYALTKPTQTACSDIRLNAFHASADSNYPNNRLAMFTYTGLFTWPRMGSPTEVVVRIPDGAMRWSLVQFTFKTRLGGTERWQESLSMLRPYAPALTQLTPTQATNLGYLRSPMRPCFIKVGLRHPRLNRPYMIGASTWDDNFTGTSLTFTDNEAAGTFNSNESVPWSGGAVSTALVGFADGLPKAYNVELWYFNDAGVFTKQSAFQIRIENCGRPPAKHGSGSHLRTCNG